MENTALMDLAQAKEYEKILDVHQQYPMESVASVADFLRNEDIYNVAMTLYQYLLEQKEAPDFHYGIGQCYGKNYDYDKSIFHLQKAFAPGEDRTEGSNYYAYILERKFLMDEAYEWYQKALKSGYDNDLWTLSHYAYFLEKYNKKEEAKKAYEDVLTINPAYTWAVKRYAIFLLKENQPEQSMKLMRDALDKFPNNPFVKLNYLEYLIIRGMTDEYNEYFQSMGYEKSPLPFQVLVDLFDYFERYLINGKSDEQKVKAYEEKAKKLKDSIHRDFDDLNEILIAKNGDMTEWKRLIQFLLK
jgi:tetratricopeptide (TPR) repeat protein